MVSKKSTDVIRVGVVGACGRMGATVCDAIVAADGLELVAVVDTQGAGRSVHGLTVAQELKALADAHAQVVVDFTVASAARVTLPWLALHGMHAVVGTTGFSDEMSHIKDNTYKYILCISIISFSISFAV